MFGGRVKTGTIEPARSASEDRVLEDVALPSDEIGMKYLPSKFFVRLVAATAFSAVASALAWANLSAFGDGYIGGAGCLHHQTNFFMYEYGWPSCYFERRVTVTSSPMYPSQPSETSAESTFRIGALMLDLAVALAVLGSTALARRIWLRRPRPAQVELKTVMIMIAVITIMLTLYNARSDLDAVVSHGPFTRPMWQIPMYLKIPLSVGIGCVAYVALSSVMRGVGGLMNVQRHGRCCENSAGRVSVRDLEG